MESAQYPISSSSLVFECQNCGAFMTERDMLPLPEKGILDRVNAGERMPDGECPYCRAVVRLADFTSEIARMVVRISIILEGCSARSLDDPGDRAVVATILAGALER